VCYERGPPLLPISRQHSPLTYISHQSCSKKLPNIGQLVGIPAAGGPFRIPSPKQPKKVIFCRGFSQLFRNYFSLKRRTTEGIKTPVQSFETLVLTYQRMSSWASPINLSFCTSRAPNTYLSLTLPAPRFSHISSGMSSKVYS
jgi:hypothetical protein